jgi:hypothetical protein
MTRAEKPSEKDYYSGREFCIVHVEAGSSGLRAETSSLSARIEKDQHGELRINPYGTISNIWLGRYQAEAWGGTCSSGIIIDYRENEAQALEAARKFLEKQRQVCLDRLQQEMANFQALTVEVLPATKASA